jgi:vacuolar protein sorting-associated protein 16
MHLLGLQISTFLLLKPDIVLRHWASAKTVRLKASATGTGKEAELTGDDDICKLIVENSNSCEVRR